jgi:SWI/SNF-related matrix-associated actin-dependent regulator of chromatin subfamily A3
MLDLLEFALEAESIPFQRFDGTMNLKQRSACLDEFRNNPECQVLLASIQCAGVG